jgi:hypothetical protein
MTTPNNSLAVRESTALEQITSSSGNQLDAIKVVGEWIAKSGLFGCTKQEQGMVIAIACREEGIGLVQFSQRYHITNDGKLVRKSSNYFAEFRKRGGRVKWLVDGDDGKLASAEFTFEGQTITRSFSIEQAKAQGLVKPGSGWAKVPGNMLRARVLTNGIGMLCPEIVTGEELEPMGDVPELKLAPGSYIVPNAGGEVVIQGSTITLPSNVPPEVAGALDVAAPEADTEIVPKPEPVPEDNIDTRPTLPGEILDALNEKFHAAAALKMMKPVELMKRASDFLKTMQPPMLKGDETLANLTVANANRLLAKFDVMIKKLGL